MWSGRSVPDRSFLHLAFTFLRGPLPLTQIHPSVESSSSRSSIAFLWLGLGVVLCAVGAKLALIQRYGTDQPYADQWAAEGMYFLRGPLYYKIDLAQLTSSHAEHRPGLTRLWVRAGILANGGQWDCFAELVVNLLIYAAFLAVVWRWLATLVKGAPLVLTGLVMAVIFGMPCAYENFLWGFQSQFLFLLLLGMLHILGAIGEKRLGVRWWLAHIAGFLGLFSIAAGAMSAGALVVVALVEILRGRRNAWSFTTLLVNLVLFGVGYWLLPGDLLQGSRIDRLAQAVKGTGYLLSWPFPAVGWCILLQAPWVILFINWWRGRDEPNVEGDGSLSAVGLWVSTIAFAIAYGRILTSDNIGVRYYDVLVLGLFVNVPALMRLVSRHSSWRRFMWGGLAAAWFVAVGAQLWQYNRPAQLRDMFQYQQGLAIEQRKVVQEFLVSNDPAKLQEFENNTHRYPHFKTTLDFLRDPKVPMLLPPTLTPDGHENGLSRLTRRVAVNWPFVVGVGIFLGIFGAIKTIRLSRRPGSPATI